MKELATELGKLPKAIYKARMAWVDLCTEFEKLSCAIKSAEQALDRVRSGILLEIGEEVDRRGKPLYTRESQREAVAVLRFHVDPEHARLKEELDALIAKQRECKRQKELSWARVEFLKNRLTVLSLLIGSIEKGGR